MGSIIYECLCQVIKMKSFGVILVSCWVALLSNPTNSAATPYPSPYPTSGNTYPTSGNPYPSTHYPYSTTEKPYPTSGNPYPTSHYPYSTTGKPYPTSGNPYTTSHYPYSTTRWPYPTSGNPYTTSHYPYSTTRDPYPTSHNPYPSPSPTPDPYPNNNATCYGHFIYKEEHNIIVDGEDDKHKSPEGCEFACTLVTECRFWKYTMKGEHEGYCELNRGTPLNEGEVVGQRNVKLIGPYCIFPPNN